MDMKIKEMFSKITTGYKLDQFNSDYCKFRDDSG